jgi:hypothetical protein
VAWRSARQQFRPGAGAGGVAVHPGTAGIEQDRPAGAGADGAVDGRAGGGRLRVTTAFVPLPHTRGTRWLCSSPRPAMSALVASKIRKPSRPSMAASAKSQQLDVSLAAASRASNCR